MDPSISVLIVGLIAIIWGTFVALNNEMAAAWGKKTQRIYGKRASEQVTPALVRRIGILQVALGTLFIIIALSGVLPDR